MTRPIRALAAAALTFTATVVGVAATGHAAQANPQICDAFGSTVIQGRYVVMNNRWGADTAQCINVSDTGFAITANHHKATNGAPAAYTAVYLGCHYGNCSPGTNLPMQVAKVGRATSSASFAYPDSGIYNVSYDIWLDPAPATDRTNQQELMIWFAKRGPIHPVGSRIASATIGGRGWDIWAGFNGSSDVVSYVAQSPLTKWSFDVRDFITNVKAHSKVTDAWYLTSIQAGFEPWVGGTGLAVNSFSASVTAGSGAASTPPAHPTTPPPSHAPAPTHAPTHAPAPTNTGCPPPSS